MPITFATAQTITAKTLDHAASANFKALGVVVLDTRGPVVQDGQS